MTLRIQIVVIAIAVLAIILTFVLIKKGLYVESRVVPGGIHSESSWEQQIPFFLNTIFYQLGD